MAKATLFAEHETLINSAITQITSDPVYSRIVDSSAFKRLKNISFLGAIDYAPPYNKLKKSFRTRHDHSLWVAALALHISKKRKLSQDAERNVVCAALLHDIGHTPLSHSMESAFKEKWGIGHHEIGTQIIMGEYRIGKDISSAIKDNFDFKLVLELIDGKGPSELSDLFNSPINIDTIDAIVRSHRYLKQGRLCYSPIRISEAAFLEKSEDSVNLLDEFWQLKNIIYRGFILNSTGIKSDFLSVKYFWEKEATFILSDLLECERNWSKRFQKLFNILNDGHCHNSLDTKVSINNRFYFVNFFINPDTPENFRKRYRCKKFKDVFTISAPNEDLCLQHSFLK